MPPYDMPAYATPMDRAYHERIQTEPTRPQYGLEKPIAPISQIGQTVPENDQMHGGSTLQGVQAAIRGGAGVIQLVLTQPHTGWDPRGGRPHGYGKEFRQALKETILANKVMFAGVEMPVSSLSNVSGLSREGLSEDARLANVQEIKNAIEFVADIGQGGGVDAVAFEFPRSPIGAEALKWNTGLDQNKPVFVDHKYGAEKKNQLLWFVNESSGKVEQVPVGEGVFIHRDPKGDWEKKTDKPFKWDWEMLMERARKTGKTPEEIYLEDHRKDREALDARELQRAKLKALEGQREVARETEALNRLQEAVDELPRLKQELKERQAELQQLPPDRRPPQAARALAAMQGEIQQIEQEGKDLDYRRERLTVLADQARAEQDAVPVTAAKLEREKQDLEKLKPFNVVAKQRTMQSYAELGIYAMGETSKKGLKQAVTVGPELGWPDYYGGHPDEFIEIIKGAREKMAGQLVEQRIITDPRKAAEEAKRHIRGTFDTSHLGMWYKHFMPEQKPGEKPEKYEERRREEFKKWYLEQSEKIAKADVIANVQLVDSRRGEHAHLPPGEGDLPLREAAQVFKKNKYAGPWISEGHEEEKYGMGKIRTSAWRTLNANITSGYTPGGGSTRQWGDVYNAYLRRTYSPQMMFGGYTPNMERERIPGVWSELPFE